MYDDYKAARHNSAMDFQVTIDAADPARQVQFWCAALGYVVEPPPGGFPTWIEWWRSIGVPEEELVGAEEASDSIIDPEGRRPRIWFQVVPEPKVVKNRLHLDLGVAGGRGQPIETRRADIDAEVQRLTGLGATHVRTHGPAGADYYAVTMQDPEGNEFCVH